MKSPPADGVCRREAAQVTLSAAGRAVRSSGRSCPVGNHPDKVRQFASPADTSTRHLQWSDSWKPPKGEAGKEAEIPFIETQNLKVIKTGHRA